MNKYAKFKTSKERKIYKGQAMVEFAFIVPLFLVLLYSIILVGFWSLDTISAMNSVSNAIEDAIGVPQGVVPTTTTLANGYSQDQQICSQMQSFLKQTIYGTTFNCIYETSGNICPTLSNSSVPANTLDICFAYLPGYFTVSEPNGNTFVKDAVQINLYGHANPLIPTGIAPWYHLTLQDDEIVAVQTYAS